MFLHNRQSWRHWRRSRRFTRASPPNARNSCTTGRSSSSRGGKSKDESDASRNCTVLKMSIQSCFERGAGFHFLCPIDDWVHAIRIAWSSDNRERRGARHGSGWCWWPRQEEAQEAEGALGISTRGGAIM